MTSAVCGVKPVAACGVVAVAVLVMHFPVADGLALSRACLKHGRRRRKGGVAVLKKSWMEPVEA